MSATRLPQSTCREKQQTRRLKEVRQVTVRGEKRWQARVYIQGRRLSRLCDSRDAALQAKAELRLQLLNEAKQEAEEKAAPVTLALACDAYLLDLESRGKNDDTINTARSALARLAEFFGARMKESLSLTETDLYAYRAYRLRQWAKRGKKAKDGTTPVVPGGAKASTVNRDLRTIRAMLKRLLPNFRFPAGVFLRENENRVKWLRPEDELLVFPMVRDEIYVGPKRGTRPVPFRDMSRLAAITIMRQGEIRTLRREYVDLAQGIVTLPRTKTEPRHVVLNQEARAILKRVLENHKSDWVFPNPETKAPYSRNHVSKTWRSAARTAGLADFHFHDLRHHGATMALNAGYTAPIVMALGGWKSERMMRRYAAVTDKTLRAAAEAVSGNVRRPAGNTDWQRDVKPCVGAA